MTSVGVQKSKKCLGRKVKDGTCRERVLFDPGPWVPTSDPPTFKTPLLGGGRIVDPSRHKYRLTPQIHPLGLLSKCPVHGGHTTSLHGSTSRLGFSRTGTLFFLFPLHLGCDHRSGVIVCFDSLFCYGSREPVRLGVVSGHSELSPVSGKTVEGEFSTPTVDFYL